MAFDGFPLGKKTRPEDLARLILVSFLLTFVLVRTRLLLILRFPHMQSFLGGNHVPHLNYGIFILAGVGGYLILGRPLGSRLRGTAFAYGLGLALALDEFGTWFNLGGFYWQRAVYDAVLVLLSLLLLIMVAPVLSRFRFTNWLFTLAMSLAILTFSYLLVGSIRSGGRRPLPTFQQVETELPKE